MRALRIIWKRTRSLHGNGWSEQLKPVPHRFGQHGLGATRFSAVEGEGDDDIETALAQHTPHCDGTPAVSACNQDTQ